MREGDYVPDGAGGMTRLSGAEEVLSRVLYRLTARRGGLPFLPELGSRLYQVPREKPSARQSLAARYVAQALEGEQDLKVTDVALTQAGARAELRVQLEWQGQPLSLDLELSPRGAVEVTG